MTDKKTADTGKAPDKKTGDYALLTGFKRAVPIILAALAVFTGLCFITQNTGALGRAISNVLLGLFSVGGYFIPFMLLIHAFFYASDVRKKRALSRAVFSAVLVITVACVAHAVTYYGAEPTFSPVEFYKNGVSVKGGGFIGGILTFCLVKILGDIGVIILAVLVFALYVTYFFASGKSTISRVLLKILDAISDFFTGIKEKKIINEQKKNRRKAERELEKREAEQAALLEDEFFAADNALKSIKISKLGISETIDDADIERRPILHDRVIHDKTVTVRAEKEEPPETADAVHERRRTTLDYGAQHGRGLATEIDGDFVLRTDDIVVETSATERGSSFAGEDAADSVFSSDFDPFDFKINQELASKASSKADSAFSEIEGITEHSASVGGITEDDVKAARMRADFEMRKRAAIEAQRRYSEARGETNTARTDDGSTSAAHTEPTVGYTHSHTAPTEPTVGYTHSHTAPTEPSVGCTPSHTAPTEPSVGYTHSHTTPTEPTVGYTPSHTAPRAEHTAAATGADGLASSRTAAEVRPSAAAAPTARSATSPGTYRNAAEFAMAGHSARATEAARPSTFKPYTPPSADGLDTSRSAPSADTITVHRSMLEPTPTPLYDEPNLTAEEAGTPDTESLTTSSASAYGSADTPTGLSFEFDTSAADGAYLDGDGDEDYGDETYAEMPEEEYTDSDDAEIPEEEQNPDVIRMRSAFPCLDGTDAAAYAAENESDSDYEDDSEDYGDDGEDYEDDEPPFEMPVAARAETAKAPQRKEEPPVRKKPDYSDYKFPPIELLALPRPEEDTAQQEEMNANADKLVDSLAQFNIRVSIKGIDRGPRITRYEVVPARGVAVNSVTKKFNDIALYLGAEGIRMEAPIPGKSAIGIEIPNKKPSTVLLRELIEAPEFEEAESKTFSCLGKDVTGKPVFADISKMPHILVAGATGMGKSVTINSILISLLYKARPDEVKLILIDPKKVEFNGYNGIPHLLVPVVTDVKQAAGVLMWACEQMEKRYELMEALEVRKLDAYNEKVIMDPTLGEPLPKMIIVIDELNDIMINVRKPAEDLIMSIAQKARAAGIHLIIGTQRPSVDVITGVIKANIPSRLSCKVASYNDSKTILEQAGAERLLDKGDMLYIPAGAPKALRVQGAFVSDGEVAEIMKYLRAQAKGDVYDSQALEDINRATQKCSKNGKGGDDDDEDEDSVGLLGDRQFLDAVDIAIKSNKVSTSLLQRKLSIGYGKAAKLIDGMEDLGIVSAQNGQKPREVLVTKDEWHEMLARRSLD